MKKPEDPSRELDRQAEALLEEWAAQQGTDLRSLGILNARRRALVARREIPLSRIRRERDEEEDYE
jgi:hypothetical protein